MTSCAWDNVTYLLLSSGSALGLARVSEGAIGDFTCCVPNLKLNLFPVHFDGPDLEVDAYCRDKRWGKLIFAEPKKKT